MANTAQARKRVRQNEKRRARNAAQRSFMRTELKKAMKAVQSSDKTEADRAYRSATSIVDRLAGKGVLHKNAAGRFKSRLNKRLRAQASA